MSDSVQISLWDDLEEIDQSDIEDLRGDQKRLLATFENELKELRAERKEQVEIVKSLRSAIGKVEVADSGRKSLLKLHELPVEMDFDELCPTPRFSIRINRETIG